MATATATPRHPAPRRTRAYRPCLFRWVRSKPSAALIERMRRAALDCDRHSVLVSVDGHAQALLVPEASGETSRERLQTVVDAVVDAVHAERPEAEIRTVIGDRTTSRERLPLGSDGAARPRRQSLASLLETIDPRRASAFVEGQLATLRAYDREHGTDLQRVLELALDHQNRNTAAQAAFMHRNTFRRQLAKALELIDSDLSCPDERLALHIALKLRKPAAPSAPRR